MVLAQSPIWQDWNPIGKKAPVNLRDAPVFSALGDKDYWIFGCYTTSNQAEFEPEDTTLEGFEILLKTIPFPDQFNAPGGLEERLHLIYEDESPINAGKHSWDSPLAGHATSPNGIHDFTII